MAREYLLNKDKKRRYLFNLFEKRKNFLKAFIYLLPNNSKAKGKYVQELRSLPRDSSISRIKNFCILTGKGRSVYRQFHLSRHQFREKALYGLLRGVKKSSW